MVPRLLLHPVKLLLRVPVLLVLLLLLLLLLLWVLCVVTTATTIAHSHDDIDDTALLVPRWGREVRQQQCHVRERRRGSRLDDDCRRSAWRR